MELSTLFFSIPKPPIFNHTLFFYRHDKSLFTTFSTSTPKARIRLSESLEKETKEVLEWNSVCKQVSAFASTSMGVALARNGELPIGRSLEETQKLLKQTTAAMMLSKPLDFSGIEDVKEIVKGSVEGELRSVSELCAVKRTIRSARRVYEQLVKVSVEEGSSERYSPLLEILQNCDFLSELEHKIEFCIDCNLSVVRNQASEDLEIIRSERKRNMEKLEALLKELSTSVFQAGGIDSPIVTKRRSRMCVGVRATYRSLVPDGIILNSSSSGATYFMEPQDAVELNNMEVRLSNSEKAEELAVLSMLTSEIAESKSDIMYLLERILELDIASARAAYARWINGVCPIMDLENGEGVKSNKTGTSLSVDIEGIRHPVLLESSLKSSSADLNLDLDKDNGNVEFQRLPAVESDLPVPIDIKIERTTKVVVISGPNTGGKTASMKTLGLASLMSKAGLYLPAKNRPRLPWFDLVLADIGDHQSLEQNLSTFSGHISRICNILELGSKESLVLIDEIGSGTDPTEGVALSTSILQYLKDQVNLAIVTTHYADLSRLKEKDARFENAAMEFCLETLQPTYRILWGSIGTSNALNIAKSIGFSHEVLDRAQKWVERLMPDKQQERRGLLYSSLMEERNTLEAQAKRVTSLHSEIMKLYHEIQDEAEDLNMREAALKVKESKQVQRELKAANAQIQAVVTNFEEQLKDASPDKFNLLVREAEIKIASILKIHRPISDVSVRETDSSYMPQIGEQVIVNGLGDKLATIVEAPADDGTALVQYGKIKVRVNKNNIKPIPRGRKDGATTFVTRSKSLDKLQRITKETPNEINGDENASYGLVIQTKKNTVDLRGMRVEEASRYLSMTIATTGHMQVLFVIHGMGTGVVKECALELLKKHPRVTRFEQESPMNYGCTVAYIK